MTFNPNIPQPTDLISNSQAQLLTNFQQLNTQYGVDHVPWNTGSGSGDGTHKKITLLTPQGSDPSLTGTQGQLYTKNIAGIAQLFFANSSGIQSLSGASTSQVSPNGTLIGVTLPSGIKVCFSSPGATFTNSGGGATYTFPLTYTTAPAVVATSNEGTTGVSLTAYNITTTTFRGLSSTSNAPVTIIAIGI